MLCFKNRELTDFIIHASEIREEQTATILKSDGNIFPPREQNTEVIGKK